MSSLDWYRLASIVAVAALLLVGSQLTWSWLRSRRALARQVQARLVPTRELGSGSVARVKLGPLEKFLVQADIDISPARALVFLLVALLGVLLIAIYEGAVVTLVTIFFLATVCVMYWKVRFQKQRRIIHEELPGIVDAVMRNIDAGRSLEHGLIHAFEDSSPVFEPLVFRLRSAVEAGRDYTRLFEDFAAIYNIPSLIMVSIALRTSSRFGSSIRPVLQQVATSLRSQQDMRREFLAATAETRFTAVTFAVLPPGLALYMVTINEQYSRVLMHTDTGHTMLIVAGVLQLLGMILIWRMIQGVGRE